ncbi:MAG: hypothetical protein GY943_36740 [Chloroflexi bacterium]|nr:hypothetical protein [Chloroflexota bacterium]
MRTSSQILNLPLGFELPHIEIPVHVWHGLADLQATFNPLSGYGHFYLLLNAAELFDYLPE